MNFFTRLESLGEMNQRIILYVGIIDLNNILQQDGH